MTTPQQLPARWLSWVLGAIVLLATAAADFAPCLAQSPENDGPQGPHVLRELRVRLNADDHNVVRSGPGSSFALVGVYPKGAEFVVIAKSDDWVNIRLSDIETGWIHSSLCEELEDLSSLQFRPNPKLFSRTGSFTLTGYSGAYAFDRKSNSLVVGGRLGYYVFSFMEVEGGISWTHIRRPSEIVESLFDLRLEAEDFHMLFYNMNARVEVLPGRQMVPFITAGIGSSILRGKTEPSINFGAGTMLYFTKSIGMRWEVRSYRFQSGDSDARRDNNNIEFTLGTTFLL